MKRFDECPKGTRVEWNPTNQPNKLYAGCVMAHNRAGDDINTVQGYEENKAGNANSVVDFCRVLVLADHDNKWHAQPIKSLR